MLLSFGTSPELQKHRLVNIPSMYMFFFFGGHAKGGLMKPESWTRDRKEKFRYVQS